MKRWSIFFGLMTGIYVSSDLWNSSLKYLVITTTVRLLTRLNVSSESRREQCSILDNLNDVVSDLKEIDKKIIKSKLPDHVHKIVEDQHISFIKLLWTPSKPNIEYCLKVDSSLEYQVWLRDVKLSETDIRGKYFPVGAVNSVSSVTNILSTLEELNDHKSEEKLVDNLVDELKHTSLWPKTCFWPKFPKTRIGPRRTQNPFFLFFIFVEWHSISANPTSPYRTFKLAFKSNNHNLTSFTFIPPVVHHEI